MARFFLPRRAIRDGWAELTGREFHHLRHVLRLCPGDRVCLFDGEGGTYRGVVEHFSPSAAYIRLLDTSLASPPPFSLILAQGLLKGPKMDLVIEKATELGVRHIVPFLSSQTTAALPPNRKEERLARWQRISLSAAKQSGRSDLPQIREPVLFRDLPSLFSQDLPKLLFWEKEEQTLLKDIVPCLPPPPALLLAIGPEGGFSLEEVHLAREWGFLLVGLGRRILRAETASIAAVALCQFLWGDLGSSFRHSSP